MNENQDAIYLATNNIVKETNEGFVVEKIMFGKEEAKKFIRESYANSKHSVEERGRMLDTFLKMNPKYELRNWCTLPSEYRDLPSRNIISLAGIVDLNGNELEMQLNAINDSWNRRDNLGYRDMLNNTIKEVHLHLGLSQLNAILTDRGEIKMWRPQGNTYEPEDLEKMMTFERSVADTYKQIFSK